MKVALLSNEGGGISSATYGLAYSLSKKKICTTVFTGTNDRLGTEKINSYLDIVRLPGFDLPPRALWLQLRNLRLLSRLPLKFNVIHGVSPYTSLAYAFLKRKEQKPFITTIHGTPRGALKAFANSPVSSWTPSDFGVNVVELPLNDFTIKKCITSSDHVVVCSYVALNELRAYHNIKTSKFSVIYNGINFDEIENVKIDIDKNNQSDFVILYAGRLFWIKGIMFLLKAFEILH
ncbi:glycosyltransferase family 4 protein, partial [Candidatus Bathyarchaeota archaeon]|nr:glycosyltransferase family 4 protein [Candidatus Bathyarchaeota archaeon]